MQCTLYVLVSHGDRHCDCELDCELPFFPRHGDRIVAPGEVHLITLEAEYELEAKHCSVYFGNLEFDDEGGFEDVIETMQKTGWQVETAVK